MPLPARLLWPDQVLARAFGFRGSEVSAIRLPRRQRMARLAEAQDRLYRAIGTPTDSPPFQVRPHRVFEPLREQLILRRAKPQRGSAVALPLLQRHMRNNTLQ